jgi:hypothetical protein
MPNTFIHPEGILPDVVHGYTSVVVSRNHHKLDRSSNICATSALADSFRTLEESRQNVDFSEPAAQLQPLARKEEKVVVTGCEEGSAESCRSVSWAATR